ncbi:glycosyltransferase [Robertmurraya kyonggiensis]|uniref:Glycosyltransferase n=1 Tax=Robertmurraya kyonggiensis TaxID=1037680 RepID=A0A4U1D5I1_9BACI|nr:glycosyltransferase family 2 protein [Robertmurraya kyonggiensis]TKC17038.1 glycosyltransferase [Robertmurraya kyonggiensis]
MKPFLSLCMIVKNEEKVIERCLSSVAHLIDEIIIVDTGSTDHTKEIVAKYTSNIYDFEWNNDFSAARNYAASKATGEWIIALDADEYIDEENFKDFIQELIEDDAHFDAYSAKILNFAGKFGENLVQNFHDRIYKNNGDISYYRNIHEQFKNNKGKPLKNKNSSLLIFHSGYLNQTVYEKGKSERNKELLDREMSNGGNKAFDYFNYGNEYCSIGDYENALESYLKAYKMKADFRLSWVSTTLVQIIICLMNLKRYNDALNVIKDAENMYSTSPEFSYLKGEIFFLRGQLEDAKRMFLQIINNEDKYSHIILRPDLKNQRPHIRLGEIFLHQEDYNGAIYHFTSVLNINKYHEVGIKKVVFILNKFHTVEEISGFLISKELVNNKNVKSYVRACFEVGNPSLASCLLDRFHEENKLLSKVALLKKQLIKHEGYTEDFSEILQNEVIKSLNEANWINIIDFYLLRELKSEDEKLPSFLAPFEKNKSFQSLMNLLSGEAPDGNIDEELLLFSLQTLLSYKKSSLCDVILSNIQNAEKNVISKIAALLFSHGYKVEALQLYDKGDWNHFTEQDFINIINSLMETNNKPNAIEFAKYAMMIFENDFRFYIYILENAENYNLLVTTLEKAKNIFRDSFYLENFKLLG